MVVFRTLAAVMAFVPLVLTHPGENIDAIKREMAMRNTQHAAATRSMSNCQDSIEFVALKKQSAARRAAKVGELRRNRGLTTEPLSHQKRDLTNLAIYESESHNQTSQHYTLGTSAATLFSSNNTCALVPETTIGPYYVTGEYIRSNITEGQAGIPMHLEMQFVDMNTCEPVSAIMADIWHCNTTGFYSGIDVSEGEGGLNTTFLRGVQASDVEGVAAFDTLFPGHYAGRITHLHVVAQTNVTLLPNNTYTGGTTLHVGQLYFEDTLISAVEATTPYNENTIAYTTWELDGWMLEEATTDYDPFVDYVQLSENLEDGLLAWITIAVDLGSDHSSNLTAAAHYYGTGGVAVSGSSKGLPPSNPNA